MKPSKRRKPVPEDTATLLLDAAEAEFNAAGFHGTDTNRIARRAGFAPQTFYRHYDDKTAVFLAVYERWWKDESAAIGAILRARGRAGLGRVADTMIAFHGKWRGFRRSLRHLCVEDDRVRAARARARKAQIATARDLLPKQRGGDWAIASALLSFERLCDAAAEGEFVDMGLAKGDARKAVMAALSAAYGAQ
jgi:AcrR family transcriptional regulator